MAENDKKVFRFTCPMCQTRLKVAEDIPEFACLNCGTQLIVIKEGEGARVEPSASAVAKLSPAELELAQVNRELKEKDDGYGIGCSVATLGVTLIACVAVLLANVFQSTVIFWVAILSALVILGIIMFVFLTTSSRDTAPLIRKRDRLQTEIELVQQRQTKENSG